MSETTIETDVVIIGAGPAGSLAGAVLAQKGRKVLCLERGFFPRFQIGESLLPRCIELLEKAGLGAAAAERKYLVKYGAMFKRGAENIHFCFENGYPEDYRFAYQVPRDDFDQALATRARALGVDLRFGHEVLEVHPGEEGIRLVAADAEGDRRLEVRARFAIDCSGYGRALPRLLGIDRPANLGTRHAVFTHVEGDRRPPGDLAGYIWVCLLPDAWIWIIPFANGRTSIGVVGDESVFARVPGSDRDKLLALIRSEPNAVERLGDARPVLKTMRLNAWSSSVSAMHGQRWCVTGNAGEFLDPIFSSGVCLALESASMAADFVHRELDGEKVDWDGLYEKPIRKATDVFRCFVDAWYKGEVERLFFSTRRTEGIQRQITSVLAGYVLNPKNSLARNPEAIYSLRTLIEAADRADSVRPAKT